MGADRKWIIVRIDGKTVDIKAEATIFKGNDLCMESLFKNTTIDFGEYSLRNDLKRRLIQMGTERTSSIFIRSEILFK